MAPSHSPREKRPVASRASPSARERMPDFHDWPALSEDEDELRITKGEPFFAGSFAGVASIPAAFRMCSSSPVPTTASTSGMFFLISSRYLSTRHPATTSFFARPLILWRCNSQIVVTVSLSAVSINKHVFTITNSVFSDHQGLGGH